MALASLPFRYKAVAYEMGRHHRLPAVDLAALPFQTTRSPQFGLPVLTDALGIREVRVEEFHEVGSHVVFLTSVVRDCAREGAREPQLFHSFRASRQ